MNKVFAIRIGHGHEGFVASHGSTAEKSLLGENHARASRNFLRRCDARCALVSFATALSPAAGGRHRYGCGDGDDDVDWENAQLVPNEGAGAGGVCVAARSRLRCTGDSVDARASGEDERPGNARRIGFRKLAVRTLPCDAGERGGRIGSGAGEVGDARKENVNRDAAGAAFCGCGVNANVCHARSDCGDGAGVEENVRKESAEMGGSCVGEDGAVYCSQLYVKRSTAVVLPEGEPSPSPSVGDSGRAADGGGSSIVGYVYADAESMTSSSSTFAPLSSSCDVKSRDVFPGMVAERYGEQSA